MNPMMTRVHMQDQVENRIKDLMQDDQSIRRVEFLQDTVTLCIVTVFLLLGLSW